VSAPGPVRVWKLALGPALAALVLALGPGDDPRVARMAAVAVWMAAWWITEAIPIPATALLPLVLVPILGIEPMREVAPNYGRPTIFLFLGGFLLALALQASNVHRRLALFIVHVLGGQPRRLVLGFIAAAFLSMWISNTATVMVLMPIGRSVLEAARGRDVRERELRLLGVAVMLGIAYAADIGGMATLVGTPPNLSGRRWKSTSEFFRTGRAPDSIEPVMREIQCTEVWGGTGSCDVSVKLAGVRGEVFSRVYEDGEKGGDIHFLSVCGMSILSKVVLADVSGHGEENAQVSGIIHDALIESIGAHDNSTMLSNVNEAFLERRGEGEFKFTTMVSLIIDSRDRSLVYAYAGHPAILHGRAGRFCPVRPAEDQPGGMPLGVLPGTSYHQYAVQLEKGDFLVVYTDAFSEARTADGGFLGEEGLSRLLERCDPQEAPALKACALKALGKRYEDDASIVVLEVL